MAPLLFADPSSSQKGLSESAGDEGIGDGMGFGGVLVHLEGWGSNVMVGHCILVVCWIVANVLRYPYILCVGI